MPNLLDYPRPELTGLLATWGYSAYYAELIWSALYRQFLRDVREMDELRPDLQQKLRAETTITYPQPAHSQTSRDGTIKHLLHLQDGERVEAVLMPYRDRYTACISTQAGCAMGCVFCATGQMGFARHLSAGEIVGQVLHLLKENNQRSADNRPPALRNIVLMGMGEPLHNYAATMAAIEIMTDQHGLAIAPRHMTLSTVGLVPAIRRLANENRPVNLAVSLHGATDAERNKLVPIGRRWPLADLMAACRYYVQKSGRRIFFEWTLIAGENDTPEQARALGRLLQGLDAHVNLIPLNPTGDFTGRPGNQHDARTFQAILREYNLPSTIRQRRGIDIAAGCGQLRTLTPIRIGSQVNERQADQGDAKFQQDVK
jgi:23S rRNA (adenine2503-C2)-methyltransferase